MALFRFFPAVGAEQIISIMDFYNMVFVSTIFCGLAFTWPVFFVLLVKFGLVGTSTISKNRKYVYAALFIGIMFITTDGGPLVDAMLLLPMIVLTEIAIYFGKRYEKSKPTISVPAKTPRSVGSVLRNLRLERFSVIAVEKRSTDHVSMLMVVARAKYATSLLRCPILAE